MAEICEQLDGLPLAVELAAARGKLMSPRAILKRLENRLSLLTGGARDLPARQRTMRAAVEWSHGLLDDEEKTLFRRLSVFAGGFTLEAAEAVCVGSGPGGSDAPRLDVLDVLTSLLDKSLLVRKEGPGGEPRFRLLEVVREYALEALGASGEGEFVRRSHARHFAALAERAHPELSRARVREWVLLLEGQHDNLRAALRWSIEHEPETAARIAGSVWRFWVLHGHLTEGRGWLEKVLGRGEAVPAQARLKALGGGFHVSRHQGDYAAGREFCEAGLAESTALGDKRSVALFSRATGLLALLSGEHERARAFLQESLALSREMNDEWGVTTSLSTMAELARTEGQYAEARRLSEECLLHFKRLGNREAESVILCNIGASAFYEGDFEDSRRCYDGAMRIAQELGYKVSVALALDGLAALSCERGEMRRATLMAGAAVALRESISFELEPTDRQFRERYLAKTRAALGDTLFDAALEQGSALSPEQSLALPDELPG